MSWRLFIAGVLLFFVYHGYHQNQKEPAISSSTAVAPSTPTPEKTKTPEGDSHKPPQDRIRKGHFQYPYLCYFPQGYGDPNKIWPCIIFLHGVHMGNDIENTRNYGPMKYALQQNDFPFLVITPATLDGWSVQRLYTMIQALPVPGIDRDRIYLTGYSMGGHATWSLATAYPHLFAAAVTACGNGDPWKAARTLGHLPVWIFHGAQDDIVPLECGLQMIAAMKSAGSELKYDILQDQGHYIMDVVFNRPELYDWMLRHTRYLADSSKQKATPRARKSSRNDRLPSPKPT